MHHHVFDTLGLLRLTDAVGFRISYVDPQLPWHAAVACVAREFRPPVVREAPALHENVRWLDLSAGWRRRSPFPSDHAIARSATG